MIGISRGAYHISKAYIDRLLELLPTGRKRSPRIKRRDPCEFFELLYKMGLVVVPTVIGYRC